jgi:hypothetical protein
MKYDIPVTWVVKGTILCRGKSVEEAANALEQRGFECEGMGECRVITDDYVEGSCKVDWSAAAELIE